MSNTIPPAGFDHRFGACHVPVSQSNSSKRIKAGYMDGMKSIKRENTTKAQRKTKRRRMRRKHKILKSLKPIQVAPKRFVYPFDPKSPFVLVFDGSADVNCPTTKKADSISELHWKSLSIASGDLMVVENNNPSTGIVYPEPEYNPFDCPPPFCMPPRSEVLNITRLCDDQVARSVFESAQAVEALQKTTTKRHCHIFGDEGDKRSYIGGYGILPNRNSRGLSKSAVYSKTPEVHAEVLSKFTKNLEDIFQRFGDQRAVEVAKAMSNLIDHPTLKGCTLYTGVATGTNKYLPAHKDKDVTMSIVMVLKCQQCKLEDGIAAYFCFPRLGMAVPLRPGDVLIFNPEEPHGLSSRCNKSDELVCLSLYYKCAVAGLNNNKLGITRHESNLSDEFDRKYDNK
jgi:hypothetical protein